MHSLLPCRTPWTKPSQERIASARLLRTVMRVGTLWFHLVVVYGFATNWAQHKQLNGQLFRQALELTATLPRPSMYAREFNLPLDTLQDYARLHDQGYVTLDQLHIEQKGFEMPATCKGATRPDHALLHPLLARITHSIEVDSEGLFDAHSPVVFRMDVPDALVTVPRYRFPESWLHFGINADDLDRACSQLHEHPDLSNLQDWGFHCEQLVDIALAHGSAQKPGLEIPSSLPRPFRGRCQPVKLTNRPIVPLVKPSRHGSYSPAFEPISFRSRKLLTQFRRVESLCQRLQRIEYRIAANINQQLQQEWKAICKRRVFG